MDYEVGNFVLKGADVFRITGREQRTLEGFPSIEYFVLEVAFPSKHRQGTSYIPVEKAGMSISPVPPEEEIRALFDTDEDEDLTWIDNRNRRINEAHGIIASGDLKEIVRLVRIYRKRCAEVPEKELSTKDREMEGRCFDLLVHVMAAACDISLERSTQMVDELL